MSEAERWLRARLDGAPPELLDEMAAWLDRVDPDLPTADRLAAAARAALDDLLARGSGERRDALPLLAADALLTHALEAQAQADVAAVAGFARRWGMAGELGRLASLTG